MKQISTRFHKKLTRHFRPSGEEGERIFTAENMGQILIQYSQYLWVVYLRLCLDDRCKKTKCRVQFEAAYKHVKSCESACCFPAFCNLDVHESTRSAHSEVGAVSSAVFILFTIFYFIYKHFPQEHRGFSNWLGFKLS